jgi:bifunctional DNase/RNase
VSDDVSIAMHVLELAVDPITSLPVVILTDPIGGTHLPITIGLGEAAAIAAELDEIEFERPMTHQLMHALIGRTGAAVERIEVTNVSDGVFGARVALRMPCGRLEHQEARPSDALALALASGAEIRVAVSVLEKASGLPTWFEPPAPAADDELPLLLEQPRRPTKWRM